MARWLAIRRIPTQPWCSHADEARAFDLWKANLTPIQREQFETQGGFDVIGSTTGVLSDLMWRPIECAAIRLQGVQWLCFVPESYLPTGDIMLAQKLALEHFEADALKVARKMFDSPYGRWSAHAAALRQTDAAVRRRGASAPDFRPSR